MAIPDADTLLVATDNVTDAALVKKLLEEEFAKVVVPTNPDAAAKDFELHRPDVLLLPPRQIGCRHAMAVSIAIACRIRWRIGPPISTRSRPGAA